ncbi:MAG: hypothetical protein FJ143_12965 [Deltaproteobacteria bacterium]|nr:hypothetical protein [Deltaproteobacteria bacterium]MBM4298642.1 hypothetical protein [Deltaproteobacteria bacterium]
MARAGVHITSIVSSNIGFVKGGFSAKKRRELDNETIRRADARKSLGVAKPIDQEEVVDYSFLRAGLGK